MKVLVLSNMYPNANNVVFGVFVKNFVESLESIGVLVEKVVITRGRGKFIKLLKYLYYFFIIAKKVNISKYDMIYVHGAALALLPVSLFKFNKTPLIINAHGSDLLSSNFFDKIYYNINKKTIFKSDAIVLPSENYRDSVKNLIPKENVYISPSAGIDLNVFKSIDNPRIYNFGYVSRVDPGKGWDVFVSAVHKLKITYPDKFIKVLMIGDGCELSLLKEKIIRLDLLSIIELKPAVNQKDLCVYYNSMESFVFPTMLDESLSYGVWKSGNWI